MRICFLYRDIFTERKEEADVYLLPFSALGEIDYERELKGESGGFESIACLSKKKNAVVIGGCTTNLHGIRKKSVAVAEKGKLLGVTDKNFNFGDKSYRAGVGVKVYATEVGKIGVAVDNDILFPEIVKSLSFCGSEWLFCVKEKMPLAIEQVVVRANAYIYGVSCALCAEQYSFAASASGKIAFVSTEDRFVGELSSEREYRLVEQRMRGFSGGEK